MTRFHREIRAFVTQSRISMFLCMNKSQTRNNSTGQHAIDRTIANARRETSDSRRGRSEFGHDLDRVAFALPSLRRNSDNTYQSMAITTQINEKGLETAQNAPSSSSDSRMRRNSCDETACRAQSNTANELMQKRERETNQAFGDLLVELGHEVRHANRFAARREQT